MNDIEIIATSKDIDVLRKKNRQLVEKIVWLESFVAILTIIVMIGAFCISSAAISQDSTNFKFEEKISALEQTLTELKEAEKQQNSVLANSGVLYRETTSDVHRCPICGWDALLIPADNGWFVQCTFCGESCGVHNDLTEAIEEWNEKGGWSNDSDEILLGKA